MIFLKLSNCFNYQANDREILYLEIKGTTIDEWNILTEYKLNLLDVANGYQKSSSPYIAIIINSMICLLLLQLG